MPDENLGGQAGGDGGAQSDAGGQAGGDNNQGGQPTDWKSGIPEDLRGDQTLMRFQDIGSLAKSYVHIRKMVNEKGLIPPKEDSPPEMWDQFYDALGRPEAPDKYEFGELKMPEGFELDTEQEKQFREEAFKAGLTVKQAAGLRDWYFKNVVDKLQNFEADRQKSREKAENDLREEWGSNYDHRVESAGKAWKMFVDPAEMPAALELFDSGLGNNPLIVRMFSRIAEAMGEDKMVSQSVTNFASYQEQAIAITKTPEYTDLNHPQHKEAVAKASKLFALAYPEKKEG